MGTPDAIGRQESRVRHGLIQVLADPSCIPLDQCYSGKLAAQHRDEALAILADVTKLPKQDLAFAFSKDDFYHSPDARPDVASVQKEIDASAEAGVIPKRIEISPKYVDLSLIEEAKRRVDGE